MADETKTAKVVDQVVDDHETEPDSDSDHFEPFSVEFESKLQPQQMKDTVLPESIELPFPVKAPDSDLRKETVDLAYLDSGTEIRQAQRLIQDLPEQRKYRWTSLQMVLADAKDDPKKYQEILKVRNGEFPEIAEHLTKANEHMVRGERMVVDYDRNLFLKAIGEAHGPRAALTSRMYLQANDLSLSALNGTAPIGTADSASTLANLESITGKGPAPNFYGDSKSLVVPFRTPEPGIDLGLNSFGFKSANALANHESVLASAPPGDGRRNYFDDDQHSRLSLSSILAVNVGPAARLMSYMPKPRSFEVDGYDSMFRRTAKSDLQKIDHPDHPEAAAARAELYARTLKDYVPIEHLRKDIERVLQNPRSTAESKDRFFQQLRRLITEDKNATTESFTSPRTRVILSLQLLEQAGDVTDVDQGDFGSCAASSIEKRLMARHPEILTGMIADTAINGTTTTKSLQSISLEKEWLQADSKDADKYPHHDKTRSLASQFASLIIGNTRFQMYNEEHGTDFRFAHIDGRDVVLDYSKQPPGPVYDNGMNGKVETDELHRFDDGKIMVGLDLNALKKDVAESGCFRPKELLDTYEALTRQPGDGIAMIHYSSARVKGDYSLKGVSDWFNQTEKTMDPRFLVYRNGPELQNQLIRNARTDNFPLIFLTPGHACTIDGFNTDVKRADYDNQWGRDKDLSLTPKNLVGLTPQRYEISDDKAMSRFRACRRQYEGWCSKNGVEPDSRYPTEKEKNEWNRTKPYYYH